MLDLSGIIHSTEFEREITIERTTAGHWNKSDYQSTKTTLTVCGVMVNPKNSKEIRQTEEGDRAAGYIDIYVDGSTPIYVTRETLTAENNISDVVIGNDGTARYRITSIYDMSDFGYYWAQAQREGGI